MKYKKYQESKDSGVEWIGQIPEKWEIKKLKFLVDCIDGKRIPLNSSERSKIPGNYPYFGANGIVDRINDFIFNEPIIILGEDGAPFNEQFKDVAFFVNEKCWINNHAHVLVPIKIEPRFFTNALNCVEYLPFVEGSTREKLTQESMNNIPICVPSVDEQIEISDFIKNFSEISDNLISKSKQQITLLEEKKQTTINQAVTKGLDSSVEMKSSGIEWIGEIPKHWGIMKLKFLKKESLMYGANKTGELKNSTNIRYLRITDFDSNGNLRNTNSKFLDCDSAKEFLLEDGDILFARSGATVGKTFIYRKNWGKACFAGYLVRFRSDKNILNHNFFYFYTQSQNYWNYVNSVKIQATIENVSAEKYSGLCVTIPPIKEQIQITDFLKKEVTRLDELITNSKKQITLLKEKKQALITLAVTGKIDVRDSVVA